jgi:hypothetical protein
MHGGKVTTVSASVGAALLGRFTFGATKTFTSKPLNLGRFVGFLPEDFAGYAAKQACNSQ